MKKFGKVFFVGAHQQFAKIPVGERTDSVECMRKMGTYSVGAYKYNVRDFGAGVIHAQFNKNFPFGFGDTDKVETLLQKLFVYLYYSIRQFSVGSGGGGKCIVFFVYGNIRF